MRRTSLSFLAALALSTLAASCGTNPDGAGGFGGVAGAGAGGTGATGTTTGFGGIGGDPFMDHGKAVSLVVSPPEATITVVNGAPDSAKFVATATFEDGFKGDVSANWAFDKLPLALVDGAGTVTANGKLGGTGTLTAQFGGVSAAAKVTVKLSFTGDDVGLTDEEKGLFDTPDAAPSGTMLYPYDQTVFARGLVRPEIMWAGGGAGDVYKVHIHDAITDGVFYTLAEPPSDFKMDKGFWESLTESNGGDDVTVEIQRLSGGQAYSAMVETWKIAQGSLRGSIYYWAVNTGQLMKIAPGAESPDVVFDSGPFDQVGTPAPAGYDGSVPPWETGGGGKRCVACHTVSKDGSAIAAVFEKKGSTASPWGTIDLTADPPGVEQITPYGSSTIYLGISPDGAHVVANDLDMTMQLAVAKTGESVPSALDGFADKTADPAFAPNGKMLAFSGNVSGFYPVEFYRADLDVIDFDPMTMTFSNRRTVVPGENLAVAFPSFAPDSDFVFYQYGDYSRARYGAAGDQTGHDDLYMADVEGVVGPMHLAAASGAGLEARNQHRSYQPTANPIAVGGYAWVVFVSPRDYGNKMLSVNDPTVENRKQLWVAAVDLNPVPGKDPSHPAFWLPGQDLSTVNMSGYWALEPCHQDGTGCNEGFECCSGFCQDDGMGGLSCVPPPGGCSKLGDACSTGADCCDSPAADCIGGFCAQSVPD
ncbi:MAG: hypothetical protein R3B70_22495 [Polyangiaceae bacterium]